MTILRRTWSINGQPDGIRIFCQFEFGSGLDGGNREVASVRGIMGGEGGAYAVGVSGGEEVEPREVSLDAAPAAARTLVRAATGASRSLRRLWMRR